MAIGPGLLNRVAELPSALLNGPGRAVNAAGNWIYDNRNGIGNAGNGLLGLSWAAGLSGAGAVLGSALSQSVVVPILWAAQQAQAQAYGREASPAQFMDAYDSYGYWATVAGATLGLLLGRVALEEAGGAGGLGQEMGEDADNLVRGPVRIPAYRTLMF